MKWEQIETGAKNVREATANGIKYQIVAGYEISGDIYRVHAYKFSADGTRVKVGNNVHGNDLEEAFANGVEAIKASF